MIDDVWYDLSNTIVVNAYSVLPIYTMDNDGAGRAMLISVRDQRTDELTLMAFPPALAGQLGWEIVGLANGYMEYTDNPNEEQEEDDEDDDE